MDTDVMESAGLIKLMAWLETNRKQVIMGVSAAIVLGLIIWLVIWQKNERETTAGEAVANVTLPQLMNPGQKYESADAYLKLAEKYPNSIAGQRALLLSASSLFVDGKYSDAKARFEKFAHDHSESPFLAQALLGIAACLDADGKSNEAITAYKSLAEHHRGENVVPQAKFALGRLYESQNKLEDARKEFEDIARNDPYGSIGSEAGMRIEELRFKHPEIFAVAASPTNAPNPGNFPAVITPSTASNSVPVPASNATPVKPSNP